MESNQEQKLRGGFYTPEPIADFLAEWAIQDDTESILEPSCGDGNVIKAALKRCDRIGSKQRSLTGVEMNTGEAQKARDSAVQYSNNVEVDIQNQDFFKYCIEQSRWKKTRFDTVIGNPPFIRYQDFPNDQRDRALEILTESGLSKTRQMNAWMPFLIGSTQLLSEDGGRLAMVIPATLLQVKYAGELREFLTEQFSYLTVVTFTELVFDDVLEEVVLLLGERTSEDNEGIDLIELDGIEDLKEYTPERLVKRDAKDVNHSTEKWILYYLNQNQIDFVRNLPKHEYVGTIGDYADVNVGVVTGRNAFFLLSTQEAENLGLTHHTRPIVTRSAHLGDGVRFTNTDFEENSQADRNTRLLNLPETERTEFSEEVNNYIDSGEAEDYHNGYKTSRRDYWYTVPSTWIPDGFLLRQIYDHPKFVFNETDSTCTDTIHRVNYHGPDNLKKKFFGATYNSLTRAFTEFMGRSYGGGVLELEPNEAEELPIPTANWEKIDLEKVDDLLRNEGPDAVVEYTDRILLREGLGLSDDEIQQLHSIWSTLQQRRLNRA